MVRSDSIPLPLSEKYLKSLETSNGNKMEIEDNSTDITKNSNTDTESASLQEHRSTFIDSPVRPSEKRKVSSLHSKLMVDKLVRSPRPSPPHNTGKSAFPPSNPFFRSSTNLLRDGPFRSPPQRIKTRMGAYSCPPN
jgi:hypothetical protein